QAASAPARHRLGARSARRDRSPRSPQRTCVSVGIGPATTWRSSPRREGPGSLRAGRWGQAGRSECVMPRESLFMKARSKVFFVRICPAIRLVTTGAVATSLVAVLLGRSAPQILAFRYDPRPYLSVIDGDSSGPPPKVLDARTGGLSDLPFPAR